MIGLPFWVLVLILIGSAIVIGVLLYLITWLADYFFTGRVEKPKTEQKDDKPIKVFRDGDEDGK